MPTFLRPLAVVLFAAALAPAADPPVVIAPKWVKGDKVEYEFTKGRERKIDGKVPQSGSSTTPITVEVLKVGTEEIELGWTFGETKLSDPAQAKALGNLMNGRTIGFTLNVKGGVKAVKNLDELQKVSDEMVDLLSASMKAAGVAKEEIGQVDAITKSQFANRDVAETLWTRDQSMLFFPVGEALETGKPREVKEELPNPFGGDPLPTKRRVELTKVDAKTGTATITMTSAFDEKAAEKIMADVVKAMTKKLGNEPPNADAIRGFRLTDEAEYTVSTKTGWVEKLKYTRTAKHGYGVQLETNEFVRKGK